MRAQTDSSGDDAVKGGEEMSVKGGEETSVKGRDGKEMSDE